MSYKFTFDPEITARIVLALDLDPDKNGGIDGTEREILKLAQEFRGTGVVFKINSILRATGYRLISRLHDLGVLVAADLKLKDIPNTMEFDGKFLREAKPEFLTVLAEAEAEGMRAIGKQLPETEIWAVTVLTSLKEREDGKVRVYNRSMNDSVLELATIAKEAGIESLVCSPNEATLIRANSQASGMRTNTPGIRYPWSEVGDQKRFNTAGNAILNGVHRVIVGRPILNAGPNGDSTKPQSRLEALKWIHDDIQSVLETTRVTK